MKAERFNLDNSKPNEGDSVVADLSGGVGTPRLIFGRVFPGSGNGRTVLVSIPPRDGKGRTRLQKFTNDELRVIYSPLDPKLKFKSP